MAVWVSGDSSCLFQIDARVGEPFPRSTVVGAHPLDLDAGGVNLRNDGKNVPDDATLYQESLSPKLNSLEFVPEDLRSKPADHGVCLLLRSMEERVFDICAFPHGINPELKFSTLGLALLTGFFGSFFGPSLRHRNAVG